MPEGPASAEDVDYWSFVDFFSRHVGDLIPGVDPGAARFFMTLHRTYELMAYDIRQELGNGLSATALRVLLVLASAGPCSLLRVAELTGMSRAATSSLLKRLEADALITRGPSPEDGRSIVVSLTGHGEAEWAEAYRRYNEREAFWFEHLEPTEAALVQRTLERLASGVSEARRRR